MHRHRHRRHSLGGVSLMVALIEILAMLLLFGLIAYFVSRPSEEQIEEQEMEQEWEQIDKDVRQIFEQKGEQDD